MVWGIATLLAAGLTKLGLDLVGFPDGHITPYTEQTLVLRHVLVDACALQSLGFIAVGVFSRATRVFRLCVAIFIAAILIVAPMTIVPNCSQFPACVGAYEFITNNYFDDGAGG